VRVRPFTEIFVEAGILSGDAVEQHFRDYRRALEPAEENELSASA